MLVEDRFATRPVQSWGIDPFPGVAPIVPPPPVGVTMIMPCFPAPRRFTIVEVEEWQALYDGENLVREGYEIGIPDLIQLADGSAFTLARLTAGGSPVDELMLGTGTLEAHKLSEIKAIMAEWRNRFRS